MEKLFVFMMVGALCGGKGGVMGFSCKVRGVQCQAFVLPFCDASQKFAGRQVVLQKGFQGDGGSWACAAYENVLMGAIKRFGTKFFVKIPRKREGVFQVVQVMGAGKQHRT